MNKELILRQIQEIRKHVSEQLTVIETILEAEIQEEKRKHSRNPQNKKILDLTLEEFVRQLKRQREERIKGLPVCAICLRDVPKSLFPELAHYSLVGEIPIRILINVVPRRNLVYFRAVGAKTAHVIQEILKEKGVDWP